MINKIRNIKSLGEKECILCTTKEECDIIMDMMHDAGLTWFSGKTYKEYRPYDFIPNQCYGPSSGMHGDEKTHKYLGYKIYKASDFIEKKWKPKQGDFVLVRNNDDQEWNKRIFLCEIPQSLYSYLCVLEGEESNYLAGEIVTSVSWKQIKQLPTTSTYTLELTEEQYSKVQDLINK